METNFKKGDRVILVTQIDVKDPLIMSVDRINYATGRIELVYVKDGELEYKVADPESLVLYKS